MHILNKYTHPISRGAQCYSDELKERLIKSFLISNKNFYRGLPCPYHDKETYLDDVEMLKNSNIDFSITHACVFHHNYSNKRHLFFDVLKTYESIVWIANEYFDLNKLCSAINLEISKNKVFKVPLINAFDSISSVENLIFKEGELVILLCGPIGRILAGEYFQNYPKTTFLCLGSYFDSILYNINYGYHSDNYMYCPICCTY